MNKRILIAEDDKIVGMLLKDLLSILGYSVTLVENGKQALASFLKIPFPVVLTDLDMPEMDGNELISHLKNFEIEPLIFVITGHSESSLIIDIMKKGIYDFIIKPVNITELTLKLKNAFAFFEMKRLSQIAERERLIRLQGKLDWIQWQDRMSGNGDIKKIRNTLFENLQTTFNQGAGFGALVSLLKIVSSCAEKQEGFYKIDAELMDLINTNVGMAEKALDTFSEIGLLLTNDFIKEDSSCQIIYTLVNKTLKELKPISNIKNNNILLSEDKESFSLQTVMVNKDYLREAIKEVITNACKFSKDGSDIAVIISIEFNQFTISVINTPIANLDGTYGIPLSCENLVFEPFFRLTKFVFDEYKTLDFGLGLTKVEAVLSKHGGKVVIRNVIDHSNFSTTPIIKVLFVISIPLVNS